MRYFTLVEELVFLDCHDSTLQTAARGGKVARDVLEYPSIKARFEGLIKDRDAEKADAMKNANIESVDQADQKSKQKESGVGEARPGPT